jgi:hypothetical protein
MSFFPINPDPFGAKTPQPDENIFLHRFTAVARQKPHPVLFLFAALIPLHACSASKN